MVTTPGIAFECPDCGSSCTLPADAVGQPFQCPNCRVQSLVRPPLTGTPLPFLDPDPGIPQALSAEQQAALAPAVPVIEHVVTHGSSSGTPPAIQAKPGTGAISRTLEFTCTLCHGRMRLPNQYLGKSILCPKCNQPQKVVVRIRPAEPVPTTRAIRKTGSEPESVPAALPVDKPSTRSLMGPKRQFNTPLPSAMEPVSTAAISPKPGSSASRPAVDLAAIKPATATFAKPSNAIPTVKPTTAAIARPGTGPNQVGTGSISRAGSAAASGTRVAMDSGMTMAIPARPKAASATTGPGSASATMHPVILEEARPATPIRTLGPWMVSVAVLALALIGAVAWLAITVPALQNTRTLLVSAESDRRAAIENEASSKHKITELAKKLQDAERLIGDLKEQLVKALQDDASKGPVATGASLLPAVPAATPDAPAPAPATTTAPAVEATPIPGKP